MAMSFRDWVEELGVREVAKRLGKTKRAVGVWLLRKGYPQVETMREIVRLTGGKVTLDAIVEDCRPLGGRRL